MTQARVRNLDFLRSAKPTDEGYGAKLYEALSDVLRLHTNVEQQTNSDGTSNPQPPPQVNGMKVVSQNGHFNISISDTNDIYRNVHYFVEHADNPQFSNPIVEHLGPSRNHNLFLGNVTRYFRAYSSYGSSAVSPPVYHGGALQPASVTGGGSIGGPAFLPSQGSGTGSPGEGLSGQGSIPFRSKTGIPPIRVTK